MKKLTLLLLIPVLFVLPGLSQNVTNQPAPSQKPDEGYKFTPVVDLKATSVKNQSATGTCWCFATTSFIESELIRMGKGEYDLSEMLS